MQSRPEGGAGNPQSSWPVHAASSTSCRNGQAQNPATLKDESFLKGIAVLDRCKLSIHFLAGDKTYLCWFADISTFFTSPSPDQNSLYSLMPCSASAITTSCPMKAANKMIKRFILTLVSRALGEVSGLLKPPSLCLKEISVVKLFNLYMVLDTVQGRNNFPRLPRKRSPPLGFIPWRTCKDVTRFSYLTRIVSKDWTKKGVTPSLTPLWSRYSEGVNASFKTKHTEPLTQEIPSALYINYLLKRALRTRRGSVCFWKEESRGKMPCGHLSCPWFPDVLGKISLNSIHSQTSLIIFLKLKHGYSFPTVWV